LSACNTSSEQASSGEEHKKGVVYVSNYPLYYFAQRIGGENIDIHFPTASAGDPAYWKPVADTIAAMQQADLVFLNGATYEQWLMNVSLPNSITVNTSHSFEEHLLESGEVFTHSHGDEGEHEHKGTAFTTWLDLSLAAEQAQAIKGALVKKWPAQESVFEANFQKLLEELMALHEDFQQVSKADPDVHVAFSHPVYQYFQEAYGVKGESLHWEPGQELDHDMLHELEHLAEDHGIKYMVWEGVPLESSVEKLKAMNIGSVIIAPAGNQPETGDFMTVMESNLDALKEVYGVESIKTAYYDLKYALPK